MVKYVLRYSENPEDKRQCLLGRSKYLSPGQTVTMLKMAKSLCGDLTQGVKCAIARLTRVTLLEVESLCQENF